MNIATDWKGFLCTKKPYTNDRKQFGVVHNNMEHFNFINMNYIISSTLYVRFILLIC